ncbi:NAD-dependent epimerase/dehydratase family protein [Thioflexithrix psekupsensis]|uniref:NAD-dependent epimerase/dehydratase domain-containing protein n=1 Tax=Thioflexithrix psekupsensis TaxID=1570016 RepID=A0A251XCR1_9GAMM|nr:NAD(P)-dependent oxidoreductase [Thioflexithrix psekupsensis]OUD15705.1 hypothetical protein TPSD3_04110 [Thioflexithrix psekupsensis]
MPKITLVAGASNQIGYFLLPRLLAAGQRVIALSRHAMPSDPFPEAKKYSHWQWQVCDLARDTPQLSEAFGLIFAAPLPLLVPLLQRLENKNIVRVIAFSSTSRFSKIDSPYFKEQQIAQQLADAEMALTQYTKQHHLPCTILRPTLIYGCGRDKTVTVMAHFIRRFGFFPMVGSGEGLRQPVHADDLAQACVTIYAHTRTFGQSYNLSGGETLTYRAMVEKIFFDLKRSPRIISISPHLFSLAIRIVRYWPKYAYLTPTMVQRMNHDLCFNHDVAHLDFGYQPRLFQSSDLGCFLTQE